VKVVKGKSTTNIIKKCNMYSWQNYEQPNIKNNWCKH
jgi:hypothetical protein